MAFDLNLPIRAVQFLFAVIALGLNGYVAHWLDRTRFDGLIYYSGDVPSQVNFIVFVSVWTMIVTIYLLVAPLKFPSLAPVIAVLALDALTMLFWFAGFIAYAVWRSNLDICFGTVCNTIVAGIVFSAFEWLLFVITTALSALGFGRRGSATAPAAPTTTV